MKAFLIDPLKVGDRAVSPVTVDDHDPESDVRGLLCLTRSEPVEALPVGPATMDCILHVADPSVSSEVRRLGEFRVMKRAGDYRSVAGRGVVLDPAGALRVSDVLGLLASSGVWVSA